MTGKEVLHQAMLLLGYTDENGEVDPIANADLLHRGEAITAQIFADLCLCETGNLPSTEFSMEADLSLSQTAQKDVMPYGIAMLLAQSEGDSYQQRVFANIFNQKRSRCGQKSSRIDVFSR